MLTSGGHWVVSSGSRLTLDERRTPQHRHQTHQLKATRHPSPCRMGREDSAQVALEHQRKERNGYIQYLRKVFSKPAPTVPRALPRVATHPNRVCVESRPRMMKGIGVLKSSNPAETPREATTRNESSAWGEIHSRETRRLRLPLASPIHHPNRRILSHCPLLCDIVEQPLDDAESVASSMRTELSTDEPTTEHTRERSEVFGKIRLLRRRKKGGPLVLTPAYFAKPLPPLIKLNTDGKVSKTTGGASKSPCNVKAPLPMVTETSCDEPDSEPPRIVVPRVNAPVVTRKSSEAYEKRKVAPPAVCQRSSQPPSSVHPEKGPRHRERACRTTAPPLCRDILGQQWQSLNDEEEKLRYSLFRIDDGPLRRMLPRRSERVDASCVNNLTLQEEELRLSLARLEEAYTELRKRPHEQPIKDRVKREIPLQRVEDSRRIRRPTTRLKLPTIHPALVAAGRHRMGGHLSRSRTPLSGTCTVKGRYSAK